MPHLGQMPSRLSSSNGSPVLARPNRLSCASVPSLAPSASSGSGKIGAPHISHLAARRRRDVCRRLILSSVRFLQSLQRILGGLRSPPPTSSLSPGPPPSPALSPLLTTTTS